MQLKELQKSYKQQQESLSLEDFFKKAKKDKTMYLSPAERLLKAIGEPELVDTSKDERLCRIFGGKELKVYKPFKEFYGLEFVIEKIVAHLRHAAAGLEEKRQVLYFLGPVGGGKSSLAEKLKSLMEQEPFYMIEGSPIFESPLGLCKLFPELQKEYNIPDAYIPYSVSPWLMKRIDELEGDITSLKVVKVYPSKARQIAISKTEPGDENNQDISTLVGKLNIRKLEHYDDDDPDSYKFNGGLCQGNRGIFEFVEMFKAPLKVLNPLLEATQGGNYHATEQLPAIPFEGIVMAHSNESEWESFRNNSANEAFLDRVNVIKVPYVSAYDDEVKIYQKYISNSMYSLKNAAPHTLEILAKFCVLSRLEWIGIEETFLKLRVYNGESLVTKDVDVKTYDEYRSEAEIDEFFSGLSTRTAFKLLSKVYDKPYPHEYSANPVHLFIVLDEEIEQYRKQSDLYDMLNAFLLKLKREYFHILNKEITAAYLDAYKEYGQQLFNNYVRYADAWIQKKNYRDPETGNVYDLNKLDSALSEIEKPAKIANPKEFRWEIVNFNIRYQASHKGENVSWLENDRIKEAIEQNLFNKTEDLLPQFSLEDPQNKEEAAKYETFVGNMKKRGYTERQIKIIRTWYTQNKQSKST